MKCLALHSGGLDSTLAIRVLQEQGVEVEAVHYLTVFDPGLSEEAAEAKSRRSAERLGIKVRLVEFSEDLLALVKDPKHGRGKHMNPCIDCHARMIRRAAAMMGEAGAAFLATGEVLGERPMSQRREALGVVEREAGVEGLLLRPLCAKLLPPTLPEQKGWVDRERLLDFSGRNRKPQFELARKLGVTEFPTPAGGCLLTDPGFAERMRELLERQPECAVADARLLKAGRHLRLAPDVKAVIGRNQDENAFLQRVAQAGDIFLDAADFPGPLTLVRGPATEEHLRAAASATLRYGKALKQISARVNVREHGKEKSSLTPFSAAPATDEFIAGLRIGKAEGKPG